MGRCMKCQTHFWGDRRYCPGCNADIWYDEYESQEMTFKELQQEGRRLLQKNRFERASVALDAALDKAMYRKAEHSMHRLRDAVADLVWLYCNQKTAVSDERITDILDYYEAECYGRDQKYRESLYQLRAMAAKVLPEAAFKAKPRPDFPENKSFWQLPPVQELAQENTVSRYEPDIMKAKHLTMTECFFYLYLNAVRVLGFLQAQKALTTGMVYEDILPLVHPDLDMVRNGENDGAKRFGVTLCYLLEDGFEQLASLYLHGYDEDKAAYLKARCEGISCEQGLKPEGLLFMAAIAPMLSDKTQAEAAYREAEPEIREVLAYVDELHEKLAGTIEWERIRRLQDSISELYAEYACLYGVGEYLTALAVQDNTESFVDAMSAAAGNGITMAAEELMRCYFYGNRGCEVQPGYARFYSRLVSLRNVSSSISETIEKVPDLEMVIPGAEHE